MFVLDLSGTQFLPFLGWRQASRFSSHTPASLLSFLRRPSVLGCYSRRSDCCPLLHSEQLPPIIIAIVGASGVWIPDSTSHLPMLFQKRWCQPVGIMAESLMLEPELIKAADQLLLWPLSWKVARARGSSPHFCFPHPATIQPRISSYCLSEYWSSPTLLRVFSLPYFLPLLEADMAKTPSCTPSSFLSLLIDQSS